MNKITILLLSSVLALPSFRVAAFGDFAFDVVPHDQDYYTKDVRNVQLIYTEKNQAEAQRAADVQIRLQPIYEDLFGYKLDEKLYIGLTSDYNQITNGFAGPIPFTRQVFYGGGALVPDDFSSISWLDNLTYHETAHNYQLNAKDNAVSSTLHSVIKNGNFILPWITMPNIVESSFLKEGNGVLNEVWHGNGRSFVQWSFQSGNPDAGESRFITT